MGLYIGMYNVDSFFADIGMWIVFTILKLARSILNLIFDIANINFLNDDVIGSVLTRAYIIVGVLMLFKIVISCVQYLINPDKTEDKEGGFGAIIKRTMISIALLALVPTIFNFAKDAQNAIIEALPKIILGQENEQNFDNIADSIVYTTSLSFFGYTSDACNDGSISGLENENSNPLISNIDDILNNSSVILSTECNGGKRYEFSFLNFLIGLGVSIFLTTVFLSIVFDVGMRTIKFAFLEMVAPIPIASYIDPKTSKKSFDSWVQNSFSVYASLFINLGVVFLVLHLLDLMFPSFISNYTLNDGMVIKGWRARFVNLAIIISLFMFAKNAPKFICDVFGIKESGSIGDMFKRAAGFGMVPFNALRSGVNRTVSSAQYGEGKNKVTKFLKPVGRGLRGAVGGALRTAFGATSGKAPLEAARYGYDKTKAAGDKKLEYANRYPKFWDRQWMRTKEGLANFAGITTAGEKANLDISAADMGLSTRKYAWDRAEAKVLESTGKYDHVKTALKDSSGSFILDSAGNKREYNVTEMLSRMKLLENDRSKEAYAGEYEDLARNRQNIIDAAKVEHITQALSKGNDAALANELAERAIKLMRSGSNSEFVNDQFGKQFATILDKVSKGEAPIIDATTAESIAKYIAKDLNQEAGAARLKAVGTQTSVPKKDGGK